MAVFKCKMCGGTLDIVDGATIAECESCGTKQTIPNLSDEKRRNLYDRANHFRRNNDYDKALFIYEQILNEDKTDAEAYWSIVLCKYGIEYVEDPSTHKRVPTINRTQFTSIFADEDYKFAIAYADGYQRDLYETEAKEIDKIQKGILAVSSKEAPFDVFICYKETDRNGRRTQDSVLAQELYYALKNEGLNVFFSRITLEDKLGTAYEPYIFAALNSAQVMVVIGTQVDYFNAVWVKNEWSRYLSLIKKGEKKTLIPAYKDFDPYDLPEEFSHLQAQDMSKLGFMQDLIRGIKKIIGFSKPSKQETVIVKESHDIAPLIRRAFLFLEDGDFASADEYAEKVLDLNPECAEAYVLKLLVELELTSLEELEGYYSPVTNNANYIKACRFADSKYRAALEGYNARILERLDTERKEKIYCEGLNLLNAKCYDDAIARFSKVLHYRDSADKIELCKQSKEMARKEQVYAQAIHRVSVAHSKDKILNYEEVIKRSIVELQSISGYKDSNEQVAKLQAKLEKWREDKRIEAENARIRAEEERLRRAREAELKRIKREKQKQQAKKVARIGVPSIIVIAIILVLTFTLFIPTGKYNKANDLLNQGKYQEAFEIYEELDGFSGSEAKIATINAIKTIESGSYEKGIKEALSAGVKVQLTYGLNGGNIVEENNAVKDRSVSLALSEIMETEKQYTYTKFEDFSDLALSTRNGYNFLKWELLDCKAKVNRKDNAISLHLVAVWSAKDYTISYDLGGGNVNTDNPIGYNPDDDAFALVNPTKKGYTFIGWTGTDLTDKTLEVVVPSGSYGNRTYTANWQVNTYVITYNPNEGLLPNTTQTVTFDKEETLAVPSRLGYKFVGWFEGTQAYQDGVWCTDKNVELKAEWKAIDYTIVYDLAGGSVDGDNPIIYNAEDNTFSLVNPTKTGYTFIGWIGTDLDDKTMEVVVPSGSYGNRSYTARWQANTYKVTYNGNGVVASTEEIIAYDAPYTLPLIEKVGYKILWHDESGKEYVGGVWKTAKDITLTAKLTPITYEISYNLEGGSATNEVLYTIEDTITLVNPTKTGYTFIGWTGTELDDKTMEVVVLSGSYGDRAYTANWQVNTYKITYNGNGATPSEIEAFATYDEDFILATIEKEDHVFLGWYFEDVKYESGVWGTANDVVLTARWELDYAKFIITSGSTITGVTEYGKKKLTKFSIPSEIDGITVTSIGANAFLDCDNLVEIIIPESIKNVGLYIVGGAINASTFTTIYCEAKSQPSGWSSGWNNANCPVVWDCNNNDIATDGNIYTVIDGIRYALKNGEATVTRQSKNITTARIFSEITYKNKTYVVTRISDYALSSSYDLVEVIIPDSVVDMGSAAFYESNYTTIYCEIKNQPSGWTSNWNDHQPVVWDCNNNDIATDGYIYTMIDGLRYKLNNEANALGEYNATVIRQLTTITTANIPKAITYKGITYYVSLIDYRAFYNCAALTNISIPYTVSTIGHNAFSNCDSLTDISVDKNSNYYKDIDGNLYTKDGQTLLTYASGKTVTTFRIPDDVTTIGTYAFYDCDNLTEVIIPESVTSIRENAFYDCDNLPYTVNSGLKYLANQGNQYFYLLNAESNTITSAVIQNGCKIIADSAFLHCDDLAGIVIPDSVTQIGKEAFAYCGSMTKVSIGNGVVSIGERAFYYCDRMNTITMGNSIISIGTYAFYCCKNVKEVIIPDSVTRIDDYAFCGCENLGKVTIGNNVSWIGQCAFSGCKSLASIVFNDCFDWYYTDSSRNWENKSNGTWCSVLNFGDAAFYFSNLYKNYYWYKL